ncbi:alpha/beta hydrolase [Gordonia sp. X0973]|uniref:alpha/beta hydrolase n=1 Tax=Gordonia sp. X0973 TaxID=2742602 RepID=UPI000F5281E1|nr:alpha/beta hydrolase [Gordonia sp. X0973]QKT07735.1 alpha/beta hydrolase [Gordonia sp. X0973]
MPPDAPTAAWLAEQRASGAKEMHEMTPVAARAAFEETCSRYGLAPVEVASVEDRSVAGPAGDIPVRVYTPAIDGGEGDAAGRGPLPVLVYSPGGGFIVGSPDSVHGLATVLARDVGAVVVSVDYRKGPEAPFPAAFDDVLAVVRWVGEHADEIGGDPTRIAVAGDSAGGNLSAVAAIDARDRGFPGLVAQVLIYPATDITRKYPSVDENGDGRFLTKKLLRWFGENFTADPSDWRASPILVEDLSGVAPAFVVTAECDPMRDQGEAYARRLADAGVPVRAQRYEGQIHGFVANLAGVLPGGRRAVADITDYLRGALHVESGQTR